jgi:hypothetical protein
MGIADVEARQPSLAELLDHLLAREPVVDHARLAGAAHRLRPEAHGQGG